MTTAFSRVSERHMHPLPSQVCVLQRLSSLLEDSGEMCLASVVRGSDAAERLSPITALTIKGFSGNIVTCYRVPRTPYLQERRGH